MQALGSARPVCITLSNCDWMSNRLTTYMTAYNKWHETELERWLSDHNVPYPTPADRKDLENLVKTNWDTKVGTPYSDWEPAQLQSYLKSKGQDVKKGAQSNKESLVSQVKSYWHETADSASDSYHSVKDWIFDRCSTKPLIRDFSC